MVNTNDFYLIVLNLVEKRCMLRFLHLCKMNLGRFYQNLTGNEALELLLAFNH